MTFHSQQLPGRLSEVLTRELACGEPNEKLYYTAKYTPICIYCANDVESVPKINILNAMLAKTSQKS